MAPLINLLLDGTETGGTAGAKINAAMVKVDAVEGIAGTAGTDAADAKAIADANALALAPASIQTLYESNAGVESFSTALANKLATLEGSHFKGVFADLAALEAGSPAAAAEGGSYAYIHDGVNPEQLAILDDAGDLWIAQAQSGSTPLTGVQIKALYEANADTNVFDDAAIAVLAAAGNLKSDGSIPMDAGYTPTNPKDIVTYDSVIAVKGTVTAVNDITTAGIYDGINLSDSPVQGHVIIEVYADSQGNLDISLKGEDGERHEGGRPNGGAIFWHNVAPDHLYGTTDPDPTLGKDGDIYFRIATP